jgi:concentrative nucleoside transporter, CNT family
LCGASNIFVGVESALVIRPYLAKMTRSELLTALGTGMATVASSTLGIYVVALKDSFPQIAGHLLSASVISIPAVIVTTKLLAPEVETPETMSHVPPEDPATRSRNLMSAIIGGAMDGVKLAVGISALLIAMLGLVELVNRILGAVSGWFGMAQPLTLVKILGWVFYPLAALLGIARADIAEASQLLGERLILTEVISYGDLASMIKAGQLTDPRSVVILSYALCGFAHIASVAIFVGGTAALVPSRRDDLAGLGMRALLAATLATLMTGCVAGIFSDGQGVLTIR